MLRHLVSGFVCGHPHRLSVVANHELHIFTVGILAEHDTYAGVLVRLAHLLVKNGKIAPATMRE